MLERLMSSYPTLLLDFSDTEEGEVDTDGAGVEREAVVVEV
jgi:hypothetical protein